MTATSSSTDRSLTRPAGDIYARIEAVGRLVPGSAEAACEALRTETGLAVQTFADEVKVLKVLIALDLVTGGSVYSPNALIDLSVTRREVLNDGTVELRATGDGLDFISEWHNPRTEGPEGHTSTYVERIIVSADGSADSFFHGYVHPTSRKIVQTG